MSKSNDFKITLIFIGFAFLILAIISLLKSGIVPYGHYDFWGNFTPSEYRFEAECIKLSYVIPLSLIGLVLLIVSSKIKNSKEDASENGETIPAEYKPISMWGYFLYEILFSIPVIGQIILLVKALTAKNKNLKNFARSYFCLLIIGVIIWGAYLIFDNL